MTLVKLAVGPEVSVHVLDGSDGKVAYCWKAGSPTLKTIKDLLVLHDCDHHVMIANAEAAIATGERRNVDSIRWFIGWTMTGVAAHDLISVTPLHIEASVYWPDCCGIHGFIRDGCWISA